MSWISIDIRCQSCEYQWDDLVPRPAPEAGSGDYQCPECNASGAIRVMSVPNPTRASYPDGYKRGAGYEDMKSAARLKAARANLPHDKRQDINREIAAVEKSAGRSSIKRSIKDK